MNRFWARDGFDGGDEDDYEQKRRGRGLHIDDRVRWIIRSDDAKRIITVLTGTVIAVMSPEAIDANDIWIRWDGQRRPQAFRGHAAGQFEVLQGQK